MLRPAALALASTQFGILTREDLGAVGMSNGAIARAIAGGALVKLLPRTYLVVSTPRGWYSKAFGAQCWAGSGSYIRGRSAAFVHGLVDAAPRKLELAIIKRTRSPATWLNLKVSSVLPPCDRFRLGPLRVTDPTRTLVDLAAAVSLDQLEDMAHRALRRRVTSIARLKDRHADLRGSGVAGSALFPQLLNRLGDGRSTDSDNETRLLRIIRSAGLPPPVLQHPIVISGRRRWIDFAYPAAHVAIEADSMEAHSDQAAMDLDRLRDRELQSRGWLVLRYMARMIRDQPDVIRQELRELLIPRLQFGSR